VDPAVLIEVGKMSASYHQGTSGKQQASFATIVKATPVDQHSDQLPPPHSSGAHGTVEQKLKNRVKLNNASFTDPRNKDVESSENPIFVPKTKQVSRSFISGGTKRIVRKENTYEVEEDWYYYLCTEYMFEERHAALLRAMRNKLEKYARTYDMTDVSPKQKYCMMLKAINAAFFVTEEEQAVRQSMKSPEHIEELHKNNKFVSKGMAGNTWGILGRKSHQLPTKTTA